MATEKLPSTEPVAIPEGATHVIAKGKVVYLQGRGDLGYTTRHSFYAERIGQGDKPGWYLYQIFRPIELWRAEPVPVPTETTILAGPAAAVKI